MTRSVYAGRDTLRIPSEWTEFAWHDRRYRIVGRIVEVWSPTRQAWGPSIRLTTSAPIGRAA